jgi:hypothetical protein
MFNEEHQYLWAKVQQGIPWIDADENDDRLSVATQLRRLVQMVGCGAIGNGWKITADGSSPYDFTVTGGDGTLDGAGRYLANGYVPLLKDDVNYINSGATEAETSICPRITNIVYNSGTGLTLIEDSAANWLTNDHVGKTIYPDITSGFNTVVVSNTANTMLVTGDATVSGETGSPYRIALTDVPGRVDTVFLNIYVDEYNSTDDPNLEHQLAVPVTAQLREKLIHTIYVQEGGTSFPEYVDADGNQHYTIPLARIYRNGSALTDGHLEDLRQVVLDSLECSSSSNKWMNSVNLCTNGSFDTGCSGTLADGGMFLDRTWGYWTEEGGSVSKADNGGPDNYPYVLMTNLTGKGQLYNTLPVNTGFGSEYPVSVGVDIRIDTLSTDGAYAGVSPLGLPYSGRILYGSSVYYVYNPSSLGTWRRISVPFPITPQEFPQISIEFGPGVEARIARVAVMVGEFSSVPPLPSGKMGYRALDMQVYTQSAPATTWVINHRMGTQMPLFHIWDASGYSLMERYDVVECISNNELHIVFDTALAGKVVLTANVCNASPTKLFSTITGTLVQTMPNAEALAMAVVRDDLGDIIEYDSAVPRMDNRIMVLNTSPGGDPCHIMMVGAIDKLTYQTTPSAIWNILHGLNTQDIIVKCFTTEGEAIPDFIQILDDNNIQCSFSESVSGYVMIKGHIWFPQSASN